MSQSGVKNMMILKNLPSNIVEEAIIILKNNNKVKQNEKIESNKIDKESKKTENDYILKEAEMLVSNYIKRLEEKKKEKNEVQNKIKTKCKKMKKTIIVMSVIILIETIISVTPTRIIP